MIPVIQTGSSFKGAELYYLHDKVQEGETVRLTTDRVAWTHSLNTMEDDPAKVFAQMRYTCWEQAALKERAGLNAEGRATTKPVMTVALSWSPDQDPSKQEMIAAGESFLKEMKWEGHQVLMVAHNDTDHKHLHLVINKIHPETGMTLDASFYKIRSQEWGLQYEREHGGVLCKAREGKYERSGADMEKPRGQHMPYHQWQQAQAAEKAAGLDARSFAPEIAKGDFKRPQGGRQWEALKEAQQQERKDYWKETGEQRNAIRQGLHQEVKAEFAPQWQAYAATKERSQQEQAQLARDAAKADRDYRKRGGKTSGVRVFVEGKDGARYSVPVGQSEAGAKIRAEMKEQQARNKEFFASKRAEIAAQQKERREELAAPALAALRQERDQRYRQVLEQQKQERAELSRDQLAGKTRRDIWHRAENPSNQNTPPAFDPKPYISQAKEITEQQREARAAAAQMQRGERFAAREVLENPRSQEASRAAANRPEPKRSPEKVVSDGKRIQTDKTQQQESKRVLMEYRRAMAESGRVIGDPGGGRVRER